MTQWVTILQGVPHAKQVVLISPWLVDVAPWTAAPISSDCLLNSPRLGLFYCCQQQSRVVKCKQSQHQQAVSDLWIDKHIIKIQFTQQILQRQQLTHLCSK